MFHERIKELRTAHGMSQVALAQKMNISKQCVSNWENGYIQPSIDMLIKSAKLFSVSTDYLLGLNDKRSLDTTGLTEAQAALCVLGYSPVEAAMAVKGLDEALPLEEMIRQALKRMSR